MKTGRTCNKNTHLRAGAKEKQMAFYPLSYHKTDFRPTTARLSDSLLPRRVVVAPPSPLVYATKIGNENEKNKPILSHNRPRNI